MAVTNQVLKKQIDTLASQFGAFIERYEIDMRGDKNLGNGNRGIVGHVRQLRDDLKEVRGSVNVNHDAIFGNEKQPDEPGLLQTVSDVKKDIDRYNRIVWLAIGVFITAGVGGLISIFFTVIGG